MTCRLCKQRALRDANDQLCRSHWRKWWRDLLRHELPTHYDPPSSKAKLYPWRLPDPIVIELDPIEPGSTHRRSRHVGLLEIVERHLGRVPISTSELYERVVDDYGSISKRVFYAILAAWRARGVVGFRCEDRTYFYVRSANPSSVLDSAYGPT